MQGKGKTGNTDLPPGFRFHPTDEELIMYYLRNQATSRPCPASIIPEVDIYKFDPWQLPEKAEFGEKEWYFFSPRDRKYPNGARPNRATVSGYWKATGTDKAIYSGSKYVGVKKALVFYKGRPPKGVKTVWIMHEYRLNDSRKQVTKKHNGSMRLDDWVLCRIYRKKHVGGGNVEEKILDEPSNSNLDITIPPVNDPAHQQQQQQQQHQMLKFPRTCSLTHIFDLDCLGPITQLLNDNTCYCNPNLDLQSMMCSSGTTDDHDVKFQLGDMPNQYTHPGKLQVNHHVLNQPLFVNPVVYGFQ